MKRNRLIAMAAEHGCSVEIEDDGWGGRDIEVWAPAGYVFNGTGTRVLVTRYYSDAGAAYRETADDLLANLPVVPAEEV